MPAAAMLCCCCWVNTWLTNQQLELYDCTCIDSAMSIPVLEQNLHVKAQPLLRCVLLLAVQLAAADTALHWQAVCYGMAPSMPRRQV
jgi:hypothetical protein